jgi:diguanylate cyclase (GGDEF)-like protein/PAS domain S-box-containing protein
MATEPNGIVQWTRRALTAYRPLERGLVVRHLLFSVALVSSYLLLNEPDVILVSNLGFTAWFPASGLILAAMLSVSPRYFFVAAFADALAGALIYNQPWLSWTEMAGSLLAAGVYAGAAYLLRGPLKIDGQLRNRSDVVRYVSITMAAAALATAAGVGCLWKDHTISTAEVWHSAAQWYIGDIVGLVGFAPFLLIHVFPWVCKQLSPVGELRRAPEERRKKPAKSRNYLAEIPEALGQVGALAAVLWSMFGLGQFYYLAFVPIVWVAMRQGIKRVVTALMVFNFGIVIAVHFVTVHANFQIKIGVLMLAVSGTGLIVGSAVTERHRIAKQLTGRTDFLNSLIDHNPLAIAILDHAGKVQLCNNAFSTMFLHPREAIAGQHLGAVISLIEDPRQPGEAPELRISGESSYQVVRRRRRDGAILDLELHAVSIDLESGSAGALIIYRDISAQVEAAKASKEYAESLHALVGELEMRATQITLLNEMSDLLQCCSNSTEAFAVISQSARRLFYRATAGALFLLDSSRNATDVKASWGSLQASEPLFYADACWALRRGKPHWSDQPDGTVGCQHLKRTVASIHLCVPLMAHGEALGVMQLEYERKDGKSGEDSFESLQDSQQRLALAAAGQMGLSLASLRLRETLREQSLRDPLTGLYNRRFMQESLEREVLRAQRRKRPLSVAFLDLDHFKFFNDRFGHDAGDAVLRTLGELLRSHYRAEDVICRYGGEEFAVILPETTAREAAKRSDSLRLAVKALTISHRGATLGTISVSIGIACYPEHASNAQQLLHTADTCLYTSKARGRDRITIAEAPLPASQMRGESPRNSKEEAVKG